MVIGLGDGGTAGDKIYVNFILFRRFTSSTLRSHSMHEDIQGVRTKKRCLVKCFKLDLSYLQRKHKLFFQATFCVTSLSTLGEIGLEKGKYAF